MSDYRDFTINIADLNVRMLAKYPYAQRLCTDFLAEGAVADVTVSVSESEISAERDQYVEHPFSDGYCEGICLYRAIAERLPDLDGFVFHGAAVTIGEKGYVFAAPSGTGKTTHISLLLKNYPEDVKIVNGDKPIIRRIGGEWRICSTPWAGKEGWKVNTTARLCGIVLVARAEENKIEKISPENYFDDVIRQVYMPLDVESRFATFDLVDEMSRRVDFYRLECNMDDSAAETSFSTLK